VAKFETVDAYIASFPPDARPPLDAVRTAIRAAAPGTEEKVSYDIPTYTLNGERVVYFAGWKRHISVYPIPAADAELDAALAPYKAARGTLRFPLDKPIPLDLIGTVAATLLQHARARAATNSP
jgi:uncharacterized protein YdhG (YjbR/CyaY superfamily)